MKYLDITLVTTITYKMTSNDNSQLQTMKFLQRMIYT